MEKTIPNMYARFTDYMETDEQAVKEPKAVFKSDGKIEFVKSNGEPVVHLRPLPDNPEQPTKTSAPTIPNFIIFSVVFIIVFSFIFTIASFVLTIQNRNKLNSEQQTNVTKEIEKIKNDYNAKLELLEATFEAEIKVSQMDVAERVETALTNLSAKALESLKDQLALPPAVIDDRIQKVFANLSDRALAKIKGLCKVEYKGKCFWAIKTAYMAYIPAVAHCHTHGAEAANIYDEDHYEKIMAYLRDFLPPFERVWLGMHRNVSIGENYLLNGTISYYTIPWHPNHPIFLKEKTQLGIRVDKDASEIYQGFFNYNPLSRLHSILCEL